MVRNLKQVIEHEIKLSQFWKYQSSKIFILKVVVGDRLALFKYRCLIISQITRSDFNPLSKMLSENLFFQNFSFANY
jgi:hypothetical protein